MDRIVVLGASAGGVQALLALTAMMPADFPAPLLVVLHVGTFPSALPELLQRGGALPAAHAVDGEFIGCGRIVVAPPDHHLLVIGDQLRLTRGPKEHHTRPAIDPLFLSVALSHGPAVIGVVLTGMLDDGTAGLQAIKLCGGTAVVQDPRDAVVPSMPMSALRYVDVDHCVPLDDMPAVLHRLVSQPTETVSGQRPGLLQHELEIALGRGESMDHMQAIGKPSSFVCPECHGSLWEIDGVKPPRYRCHTGHAFTLRTLQHLLTVASDEALWNALRALEDKQRLLQHMVVQLRAMSDGSEASRAETSISEIKEQLSLLRQALDRTPDPVE